jgi:hypothetical protein
LAVELRAGTTPFLTPSFIRVVPTHIDVRLSPQSFHHAMNVGGEGETNDRRSEERVFVGVLLHL